MNCRLCHTPLEKGYNYCPGCGLKIVPVQVKKQHLRPYLTKDDLENLAKTSRADAVWLAPYVRFNRLPPGEKIRELITHDLLPDDEVVVIARQSRNVVDILRLASARGKRLARLLQDIVEERIDSRGTSVLVKKTYLGEYIRYLHEKGLSIPDYIDSIKTHSVRSLAIEAYIPYIAKPSQKTRWIEKITDPVVRRRVVS